MKYSVTSGGFIPDARHIFEASGELDAPAGITLPYQYVKNALTLSSAAAIFTTAGTATYTLTVVSTDTSGANSVTHISGATLTPASGTRLTVTIGTAAVAAGRIFRATLTSNSGTPSTDFTLTLE
jgi:hypothetical protein